MRAFHLVLWLVTVAAMAIGAVSGCRHPHDAPPSDNTGSETASPIDTGGTDRAPCGEGVPACLPLSEVAEARYGGFANHGNFGWRVACGPDRAGDGTGDLAATASSFDPWIRTSSYAAALAGPVEGDHSVDEVADLIVRPREDVLNFSTVLGIVAGPESGLLLDHFDFEVRQPAIVEVVFAEVSGAVSASTDAIGHADPDSLPIMYLAGDYVGPVDLTGDGSPDFALGAYVFETVPEGFVDRTDDPGVRLALARGNPEFTVDRVLETAAGDLDGDGQDDLVVTFGRDPRVFVVFGPVGATPADPAGPDVGRYGSLDLDSVNHSLTAVAIGDLDGDGSDDLVVGDKFADGWNGAVYVWFGPIGPGDHDLRDADRIIRGREPGQQFGESVALLRGEGPGLDLVVGAPARGLDVAGLIYVFESLGEGVEPTDASVVWHGEQRGDTAGFRLAGCDTDGDGRDELVVGAPGLDLINEDEGAVYWLRR